ncbi:uncharacterized protein LOC142350728 [Convolutriloba macropyga]|uniref:uncharacterized protein LOC142350728 n=1 Tax=Convolutriloba macropyga TaxID=536237 RepID=UPI003F528E18
MAAMPGGEILAFFKAYDADNSGFITPDEIKKVLKDTGNPCPEEDVEEMMKEMDKDQNGRISYEEFYKALVVR